MSELKHYGVKRRSGRYPYGSGDNPYQHENRNFLGRVKEMQDQGMSEKDIATALGLMSYNVKTKQIEGNINMLREKVRIAKNVVKKETMQEAWDHFYKDKMSPDAIAKEMHLSVGTVNNYIDPMKAEEFRDRQKSLDMLREEVDSKKYIDVGKGAAAVLGVTENKLRHNLIPLLENEGYTLETIRVKQAGTGNYTNMLVLATPGTKKKEIYQNINDVMPLGKFTINENGETKCGMLPPKSIDSKRIEINYADTGTGAEKDGLIEIRRGVEDLCLNKAKYAQVRIAVDDTHYLKGMAAYADDLPDGIDIRFNTSKNHDVPIMGPKDNSVLKPLSDNKENPFGATILQDRDLTMCQQFYTDKDGNKQQSLINVVTEEGKWDTWSKNLASQMLSKQDPDLVKKQLNLASAYKKQELDEIQKITNPTLKKMLLQDYADGCDSDAVHLKAAALPRQTSKVLLPITTLSENEIFAPGYRDGETVALVRYPHQGIYEIPTLKVNNSNAQAIKMLGKTPTDCVGINHKTAERLSGADFDGDTAIVIPIKDAAGRKLVNIKSADYPDELKNFDAKSLYRLPDGVKAITDKRKNLEMGIVSNLITDMTLMGAPDDELIRATKHSMVVIDAVKHRLDIAKSARDNNIAELHLKYQGKTDGGAATIVSKAKSQDYEPETKDYYKIDPDTGKKIKTQTGGTHLTAVGKSFKNMTDEEKRLYNKAQSQYKRTGVVPDDITLSPTLKANKAVDKMTDAELKAFNKAKKYYEETGNVPEPSGGLKYKEKPNTLRFKEEANTHKTNKMSTTDDATTLMSPHKYPKERLYAEYANTMKALANEARKEIISTKNIEKSPSAAKTYKAEVDSLTAKLRLAETNAPKERLAQRATTDEVRIILQEHPEYKEDVDKVKKINNQVLNKQRSRFGANKKEVEIHINEKEWNAIQAGAFSGTQLRQIFLNTNSDELKKLATPKNTTGALTQSQVSLIKSMKASGYTLTDIAEKFGKSPSTISKAINGTL